ncbi:MAG TPA: ATP-binding protein [Rhizomicrobium sp.]
MSFAPTRLVQNEGFRIAAVFLGIFMLAAAALSASVLFIVDAEFRDQIVQFAQADIAAVRQGYDTEGIGEAREVIAQRMAAPGASDYFLLQQGSRRLAGNLTPMAPRIGVFTLPGGGAQSSHAMSSHAMSSHAILGTGIFLAPGLYAFSGSDLNHADQARAHILQALGWVLLGASLLGIAGGILVSRSFLARTGAIAQACRAIMAGNLAARIPLRGTTDELDRLSQTINTMLDRIVALMENLRQVTSDIAHDLRTPVTHLRHRLERARGQAASPADYDAAMEAAIAAADEILALFAALLRIAQIEGGSRRAGFAALELGGLLAHLRDIFAPVADDAGHRLELVGAPATVSGDRELLLQLFSNLIENAIVHTPRGTVITVTMANGADGVRVTVVDDGPGVPREEHAKLFRRLYRREASRTTPGYGLGLALVAAIAELHGARLETGGDKTVEDGGFSVSLLFPVPST